MNVQYTVPVGTDVVRWAYNNEYQAYIGQGFTTTKLVVYDDSELIPYSTHNSMCKTYGWEPDTYWTFYLPAKAGPWRFVSIVKRNVKTISL